MKKDLHKDELENAPLLDALKKEVSFDDVPEAYFDKLEGRLKDRLTDAEALDAAPNIRATGRTSAFEFPADYLDKFADRMEDAEVLSEAPILMEVGRKGAFIAPNGYFDALPEQVYQKIKAERQPVKVISMSRKASIKIWWSAAAAVVILVAGLWAFGGNTNSNMEMEFSETELFAMLETEGVNVYDIAETLELSGVELETESLMEDMSDEEISDLLESMDISDHDIEDEIFN